MKRKINLSIPLITLIIVAQCVTLFSCAANDRRKNPQELLEEYYGSEEFKISFSSETLDTPLEDMTYSTKNIPILPIPVKVGYIFGGWFLDSDFVVPYSDELLKLTLKNIVLYPKWIKETFTHNGTYEIDFDAHIVDGTVKIGSLTEKYGGYEDFSDAIIKDQCHIEKSGGELLLKFQYDCGVISPFEGIGVLNDAYEVRMTNTDITVDNVINSQADTVRTLFINIEKWDLSEPLYFDVSWTNYKNPNISKENRKDTTTTYRIQIDLTKIIGFSQAFVDESVELEEGYYLAKSYYRKEDNLQSMAKTFNGVYSYIYSDGKGNYKLIKQTSPYVGLVDPRHPKLTDNYYDQWMTFTSCMTVYDIDEITGKGRIESDFYPEKYNGGSYRTTTTEFHADTGKMYTIIDLAKDLKREYVALTAVSGYMERESGMGYIRQILSIDYNNLIRLPEVDYKPLDGDAYEFESEFSFYPGNYEELDQRNLTHDALMKHGFSIEMPNFYYSATSMKAPLDKRQIHSSKFTVTPTKQTAGIPVSESRYKIAEFEVNTKVYGYDVRDGNKLFVDRMSTQTFEGAIRDSTDEIKGTSYNSQLRDVREVRTGISCNKDDVIDVKKLFASKVSKTVDFANVTYTAYEMNDGKIDFESRLLVSNKKIDFNRDMAIEYKYTDPLTNGEIKTVVELKKSTNPIVHNEKGWYKGDNGHYKTNKLTTVNDMVAYPDTYYSWGEVKYKFIDNFYGDTDGSVSINPAATLIVSNSNNYTRTYLPSSHADTFVIPDRDITVTYEMMNEYGERQYVSYDFTSSAKSTYEIKDDTGFVIENSDVKYDKNGYRVIPYTSFTYGTEFNEFKPCHFKTYTHKENGYTSEYVLEKYTVYSNKGTLEGQAGSVPDMLKAINEFLSDKSYGCLELIYRHNYDVLEINFLYKINYNGERTYKVLHHDAYFTLTPYTFGKIKLLGSDMQGLASCSVSVNKYVDGRKINDYDGLHCECDDEGSQFRIIFKTPGHYRIELKYSVPYYLLGSSERGSKYIIFRQDVEVDSNMCDIEITYITDDLHPFADGSLERTEKYSLSEVINLLDGNKYVFNKSKFKEDRRADILKFWGLSTVPSYYRDDYRPKQQIKPEEFINTYNSKHITLYAIWQISFPIYCVIGSGIETQIVYANLDYDGESYSVSFPYIQDKWIKENTEFAGWTGGFLGGGLYEENYASLPYRDDYYNTEKYRNEHTIYAVFKEYKTVKFEIDSNLAKPKRNKQVLEGECIENYDYYMNLTLLDSKLKFYGYYVKGSGSTDPVDLSKYVITEDTVFVAIIK